LKGIKKTKRGPVAKGPHSRVRIMEDIAYAKTISGFSEVRLAKPLSCYKVIEIQGTISEHVRERVRQLPELEHALDEAG
jgi:hypothetical protein